MTGALSKAAEHWQGSSPRRGPQACVSALHGTSLQDRTPSQRWRGQRDTASAGLLSSDELVLTVRPTTPGATATAPQSRDQGPGERRVPGRPVDPSGSPSPTTPHT